MLISLKMIVDSMKITYLFGLEREIVSIIRNL